MIKVKHGRVSQVKETTDGVVYVKVESKGELLGGHYPDTTEEQPEVPRQAIADTKILKSSPDSPAGFKTYDEGAVMAGSPFYRFVSTKQYGNFVVGPVTFTAHPESIRVDGVFRFNGLLTSTVPSTIVTPVATFKIDLPGKNMANILKQLQSDFERLMNL